MKSIIVLFDQKNKFENENCFDGKSAIEVCNEKYKKIQSLLSDEKIDSEIKVIDDCKTVLNLLEKINKAVEEAAADFVIFSYADLPFISPELVLELVKNHLEYKTEYTFADGYPYGIGAEIIDKGTAKILESLAAKNQSEKELNRTGLWELIKSDINSFDVESIIADDDFRMLRLAFDCENKDHFTATKNLYSVCKSENPMEISIAASNNLEVLKTVPCFYNIQIDDYSFSNYLYSPYHKEYEKLHKVNPVNTTEKMSLEKYSALLEKIVKFSDSGVISLSAFGEAFHNADLIKMIEKTLSYSGFSAFLETDGLLVTDEIIEALKSIVEKSEKRTNNWPKIMVAVNLDAFTSATYNKIHNVTSGFEKAVEVIGKLSSVIPGNVYPQFTRMNENEEELELFWRYWKEKTNSSGGELIIQKYDDFCGLLPPCKPADLSPVERNVCWHLRRDMTILSNGNVPLCRECIFENVIGNVFEDDLETIWKKSDIELKNHMECKYNEKCKCCDEYYTFNF